MCSGRDQSAHARTAVGSVILPMQRLDTKAVTLMPAVYAGTKTLPALPCEHTWHTAHRERHLLPSGVRRPPKRMSNRRATYCPRAFVGHESPVCARTLHVLTSMYRTYILHLHPLPQV